MENKTNQADPTDNAGQIASPAADSELIAQLVAIVGNNGVLVGGDVSSRHPGFFMDKIDSELLVRPADTSELSRVLALCNARGQSVVTQGGMSGWVRGTQTRRSDLIVSLERMKAIEDIDTVNRTVTVQAGVVLQTLQETLDEHQLVFPLDLGGRGSCQVGGNASTNAGGVRVIRYGMMRQLVLGVEAVMADGTVISSMNRMLKNNAGYDLKQLFIGSEGTLGVITRLVLRLYEKPSSNCSALVGMNDFASVAAFFRYMDRALGGNLSAFEVIDSGFYAINTEPGRHKSPMTDSYPYYVITESLGFNHQADSDVFEQALMKALEKGYIADAVIPKSESERESIWEIREDLEHVVADLQPFQAFDVSMPIGDMENYMAEVKQAISSQWDNAKVCFLGHVGDGNLHIAVGCASNASDALQKVERCVYSPLEKINGSISAEHGIGLEKKAYLSISRSTQELDLMRLLKRTLDPNTILNPGKVLDMTINAAQ